MTRSFLFPTALAIFAANAIAQEVEIKPLAGREAVRAAKIDLAGLEPLGKCPVKIDPNPDKAIGLRVPPDRRPLFLFVPIKGLENFDFNKDEPGSKVGQPIGYLFPSLAFSPVVDGLVVNWQRLGHTKEQDPRLGQIDTNCLVLSAQRQQDRNWLLNIFGTDEKPLLSVPLDGSAADGQDPAAIKAGDFDPKTERLALSLTFGGRRASVPFGVRKPDR